MFKDMESQHFYIVFLLVYAGPGESPETENIPP